MTTNQDIPFAKSLVDYIFRWMGMQFIPGYREANAPNRGRAASEPLVESSPRIAEEPEQPRLSRGENMAAEAPPAREPSSRRAAATMIESMKQVIAQGSSGLSIETSTLTIAMESVGDAPPCDTCGTITVRSGTCYKCLNCGASMGCS
jgi:ribonucleoside-diphosphate reductase alpha chain